MRSRLILGASALTAAAVLTLSACGDGGESSSTTSTAASSVDIAALDTGTYTTEPAKPYGYAQADAAVDAQRMAEYLVLPFQIDKTVTIEADPTTDILNEDDFTKSFSAAMAKANPDGVLYGFSVAAQTPATTENGRSMQIAVMRYNTPAIAKAAAAALSAADAKDLPDGVQKRRSEASSAAGSFLVTGLSSSGKASGSLFTPYKSYLIYTRAVTPESDVEWLTTTAVNANTEQVKLIDRFPGLPTREQNPDPEARKIKLDQNSILIYALPYTQEGGQSNSVRAVYGPQGIAHFASNQREVYSLLAKYGSSHNAIYKSSVYRASTADNGAKLLDDMASMFTESGGAQAESPKGLSAAKCIKAAGASKTTYRCLVRVGRYVGSVYSDTLSDAHQQASAQYVILTKADQNAN